MFAARSSFALPYCLPECLEFPIETTVEVSVACMLSFLYEDRINVYSFIARVAYQLAQTLYIDVASIRIGIFILILLQINNSFRLCNSDHVYNNAEGTHLWCLTIISVVAQ